MVQFEIHMHIAVSLRQQVVKSPQVARSLFQRHNAPVNRVRKIYMDVSDNAVEHSG